MTRLNRAHLGGHPSQPARHSPFKPYRSPFPAGVGALPADARAAAFPRREFIRPLPVLLIGALGLFLPCASLVAQRGKSVCTLIPTTLTVDQRFTGNSDANGLLEPGETVDVEPHWRMKLTCQEIPANDAFCNSPRSDEFYCFTTLTETGTATRTTLDYVLLDDAAQYPSLQGCSSDCYSYSLFLPAPTDRPARHWDIGFKEVLSGTTSARANRKVHVGDSFADVPRTHPFYQPIETLFHNGVTNGCSPQDYCPSSVVTRSDAAILIGKAIWRGASIPSFGTVGLQRYKCEAGGRSLFDDVAPTDPLCRPAHYLASRNIMKACRPSAFCPAETISRVVMAVYVARAVVGGNDDDVPWSGCDPYTADARFADVPVSDAFCKFVNFLSSRGVVAGCGPNQFCPAGLVTREQMAKFLVKALALNLNGP